MDLALNILQRLICHKIQPNKQPTIKIQENFIRLILLLGF